MKQMFVLQNCVTKIKFVTKGVLERFCYDASVEEFNIDSIKFAFFLTENNNDYEKIYIIFLLNTNYRLVKKFWAVNKCFTRKTFFNNTSINIRIQSARSKKSATVTYLDFNPYKGYKFRSKQLKKL